MKTETQKQHLNRLNKLPRSKEWCANISAAKKKGKYVLCHVCTKEIWRPPWQLQKYTRYFCSNRCAARFAVSCKPRRFGTDHPCWRGGSWKNWRIAVMRAHNHTCQRCGLRDPTPGFMDADHVIPISVAPEFKWSISNGQCLCPNCHRKKHLAEES